MYTHKRHLFAKKNKLMQAFSLFENNCILSVDKHHVNLNLKPGIMV